MLEIEKYYPKFRQLDFVDSMNRFYPDVQEIVD